MYQYTCTLLLLVDPGSTQCLSHDTYQSVSTGMIIYAINHYRQQEQSLGNQDIFLFTFMFCNAKAFSIKFCRPVCSITCTQSALYSCHVPVCEIACSL